MMDMKRIYNILLIMILSLFLLPLGGCFDSDINRSMYEADGEDCRCYAQRNAGIGDSYT